MTEKKIAREEITAELVREKCPEVYDEIFAEGHLKGVEESGGELSELMAVDPVMSGSLARLRVKETGEEIGTVNLNPQFGWKDLVRMVNYGEVGVSAVEFVEVGSTTE